MSSKSDLHRSRPVSPIQCRSPLTEELHVKLDLHVSSHPIDNTLNRHTNTLGLRICSRAVIVGRVMHILPAGLWSAIAPLQVSPRFRSNHRTAHRRMGRLFIAMSVSISIGIVPIITSGATILYQVE